jgi:hypothetical protein
MTIVVPRILILFEGTELHIWIFEWEGKVISRNLNTSPPNHSQVDRAVFISVK